MIIFFLIVLLVAAYAAFNLLLPEMRRSPNILKDVVRVDTPTQSPIPAITSESTSADLTAQAHVFDAKLGQLEVLIAEKNRQIRKLHLESVGLRRQSESFDKIKTLMEDEIKRLKENNRLLKAQSNVHPARQPVGHNA